MAAYPGDNAIHPLNNWGQIVISQSDDFTTIAELDVCMFVFLFNVIEPLGVCLFVSFICLFVCFFFSKKQEKPSGQVLRYVVTDISSQIRNFRGVRLPAKSPTISLPKPQKITLLIEQLKTNYTIKRPDR